MHDITAAEAAAREILRRIGNRKISEIYVTLELGALRFHDPRQVRFWVRELVRKELGGVRVRTAIREIKPVVSCACGFSGPLDAPERDDAAAHHGISSLACPGCGSTETSIEKGDEFIISRLSAR